MDKSSSRQTLKHYSDSKRDSISSEIVGMNEGNRARKDNLMRTSVAKTNQSMTSNLQSQETINTMINTQVPQQTNMNYYQPSSSNTFITQTLQRPSFTGGILKKSMLSFQTQMSYQHQYTNQSTLRSQENKLRHVQILKNILKQAKKQRKEKKRAKKLDKRKNTFLKRGGRMQTTLFKQNSQMHLPEEETESDDEEDIEGLEMRQNREIAGQLMFMPDSTFKAVWDFFVLCLIIQQSFIIPIILCFGVEENNLSKYSQLAIDIIFMIDILMSFNTAVYHKGVLLLSRKQISTYYIKTWFFLDLLSSLPYDILLDNVSNEIQNHLNDGSLSSTSSFFKLLKVIRFMRFFKLLRVFKLDKIIITVEEYIVSDEVMFILRFAKIMTTIIFFAHWMACFYFAVGFQQLDSEYNSWIIDAGIQDESVGKQYIFALYWAIQTMCTVGYGDLPPRNPYEQLYVTGAEILASGIYALTLNNVSLMVQKYNLLAAQYREKMMYVNQFMTRKALPKELKLKVWRYLQYVWEIKKQIKIEEDQVFEVLNQDLKEKITVCMNGFILQTIPFFESFEMQFVSELTFHTKKETYAMDDNIFVKDDYFGEIAFFTDEPRCATIKSRDFTEVYTVDRDIFLELAEEYDEVIKLYHEINTQIFQRQDYSLLKLECYICKKLGHRAIDCYQFIHKKGNLIQIYNRVMGRKSDSMSSTMKKLQMKMNKNSLANSPNPRATRASRASGILVQDYDFLQTNNKKKSSTEVIHDQTITAKSKSQHGKWIDQNGEYMNDSFQDASNKRNKLSNNSLQNQQVSISLNDSIKNKKKFPNFDNDFSLDTSFYPAQQKQSRDSSFFNQSQFNNSILNTSLNENDISAIESPSNNQQQQKRKTRKSVIYEKLVIKLRQEADNPTIVEESSESSDDDSFKSSVSDVEDFKSSESNEESKLEQMDKNRLKMPFQNQYSFQGEKIDVQKLSYKIGNTLAIVPEENESLYSYVFGNQKETENSQSRKESVYGPQNNHESGTLQYQNTKFRLPSFNSQSSKQGSQILKIKTKKTFDKTHLLHQHTAHNIGSMNLQVTPKPESTMNLESDGMMEKTIQNDQSSQGGNNNYNNTQQLSITQQYNYLDNTLNPARLQNANKYPSDLRIENSPLNKPTKKLLEVSEQKTLQHFNTTIKKRSQED